MTQAGLIPSHGYASAPVAYASQSLHAGSLGVAHAAPYAIAHAAPVHAKVLVEDGPAEYSFQYGVHDAHTGDVKEQHEERHGDAVQGYYTLNEADGTKRIVHYTADDHNGFNAVVQREGHAAHPAVAIKAVAHAAPVYAHAAPLALAHGAPLAYASHGYHH